MENKDLLKGTTVPMVLQVISIEDSYGYDIIKKVKEKSGATFDLKEGTLYPVLHSLEKDKLIESYWTDVQGQRKRKYYRITRKGRVALREKKKNGRPFVVQWICYWLKFH